MWRGGGSRGSLSPGVGSLSSPAGTLLPALRRWPVGRAPHRKEGRAVAQGACGLRTGRAEQPPSRTSGPVLVSCAGLQQASPQPPGRGRLPQVLCEQEGWLQAGEAGDTSLRGPEPSCQPAGLHHHLLPSWSFAGVSPGRRMPQLHSPPGACSPLSPLRLRLVDTFPSTEEGGWLCPQDAGRLLLPPQDWPPRAGKLARA